jgi:hypothetical protein
MIALVLASVTALLPATAARLQAARPEGSRNPLLEGVAVQAGDAVVVLSEYERFLERARASRPAESATDRERQRTQLLRDLALLRLEEQGGADLGVDPALIERNRRLTMEAAREEKGIEGYLAELESKGSDALTEASDSELGIYRWLWERRARGQSYGAKRDTRDPGLRPGELRHFFEENRAELVTVQLRWLIVSSESVGGPEAALQRCEDVRARVLAGEDFGLLVQEHGVDLRDTLGLTPFLPVRGFREPAMAAFAGSAAEGDLSAVVPLTDRRTGKPEPRLGYQLAELNARRIPEFADPEVQRVLRRALLENRADRALGQEREHLWRSSFVWVNPILGSAAAAASAGP